MDTLDQMSDRRRVIYRGFVLFEFSSVPFLIGELIGVEDSNLEPFLSFPGGDESPTSPNCLQFSNHHIHAFLQVMDQSGWSTTRRRALIVS